MFTLEKISPTDTAEFRSTVLAYWQELMPYSDVMSDPVRQEQYFQQQYTWEGGSGHPYWALLGDRRIGIVNFSIFPAEKRAEIEDFYVFPEERRLGYGSEIMRAVFRYFDGVGIERVDLTVRRDNPNALAFWEAQGFMLANYHLRQYRDPSTGTAFRGALSSDFPPPEPAS
ncbi:MAG: GNAT family N-acetyltransferase [Chloroflexota bacterium]